MAVKIVTDSTSDITAEMAAKTGITVVPLTVSFGHESFLDRAEMSSDEFFRRLTKQDIFPTTTQPSPNTFAQVYNKLCKETSEILVLTISRKLSGTYDSALSARALVENKNCRIEVIDSETVIMGLGLLAIAASELAARGLSLDRIKAEIVKKLPQSHAVMSFDTLKYLAKGGRIGKAQGFVGALLSIKPVLTMRDGEVAPLTRVRSKAAAIDALYNFVAEFKNIEGLAVEHATTPEDTEALIERLGALYPKEKIYRSTVSSVIGTYSGPNVLSVSLMATA